MLKLGPIGIPELVVILLIVLIIFGPKNLPKLGSAVGKTVKNLREGMGSASKELEDASDEVNYDYSSSAATPVVVAEKNSDEESESASASTQKTVRRVVKKKVE